MRAMYAAAEIEIPNIKLEPLKSGSAQVGMLSL